MGHWYQQDGTACYFQPDGKDTTLRHARKQDLVPSVSEVINIVASPGLDVYRQNQILDAVILHPLKGLDPLQFSAEGVMWDDDFIKGWKKEIIEMSKEHAKKAADDGKIIHDKLEQFFKDRTTIYEYRPLYNNVLKTFAKNNLPTTGWLAEQSFASPLGYGGCVDLHHPNGIVLDFKTKNNGNFSKARAYDGHHMQTAAYAVGLFVKETIEIGDVADIKRYNLFINKDNFEEMRLTQSDNFDKDWKMFYNLLEYWKLSKNYDGSF